MRLFQTAEFHLQEVEHLKTRLDELHPLSPDVVAELQQRCLVRFIYNSNAIEGNTLTQRETEMILERGITVGGKTLVEHLEVVGHRDALNFVIKQATAKASIKAFALRQLHALLMQSISRQESGQYRRVGVQSAGTNYVYPAPHLLDSLMADFVDWLNSCTSTAVQHPLAYVAEAHLRFVTIHPFRDGNGRTGRLLMNLLLLNAGYPIVIISNAQRATYMDAIVAYQQQNQGIAPMLELLLHGAIESLLETLKVAENR